MRLQLACVRLASRLPGTKLRRGTQLHRAAAVDAREAPLRLRRRGVNLIHVKDIREPRAKGADGARLRRRARRRESAKNRGCRWAYWKSERNCAMESGNMQRFPGNACPRVLSSHRGYTSRAGNGLRTETCCTPANLQRKKAITF